ncbi:MAG: HDOD domain-containing protein [Fimbriimonadaceae bacterium]|nr:HDOD domain-containing protein [Fimbriimonadaceae bacterium]
MSAAPISYNEDNDSTQTILDKVNELAVLPQVVYKVVELSASTDTAASEIERAIVVDPGFSTKLLTAANSAYYGLPKKVTSVKEAIMFLGFKTVRQIAMTVGIYDMFVGKNDKESLRRRAWWRHSIDTAVCARWLAKETKSINPDNAYTCGLLHYIGKTLLDRFGEEDYELTKPMIEAGMTEIEAELELFGVDHVHIAKAAAQKWGFPEELIAGIDYHTPTAADSDFPKHGACIALASAIAFRALEGLHDPDHWMPSWAAERLGIGPESYESISEEGSRVIAHAASLQI